MTTHEALQALLTRYTNLINSGDAGFWDPETEQVVIDARAALKVRDVEIALLRAELAVSRANRAADMVLLGQVRDIITEAEK